MNQVVQENIFVTEHFELFSQTVNISVVYPNAESAIPMFMTTFLNKLSVLGNKHRNLIQQGRSWDSSSYFDCLISIFLPWKLLYFAAFDDIPVCIIFYPRSQVEF